MQKLSVIIFSKDDLEQALDLIKKIYSASDEIVLMDASGKRQRDWIAAEKARLKLDKLRIFRVVALGYREPLMMYALTKCRNNWVLDLDTDMLPSEHLKSDIPRLASSTRHDAYAIALYSVHSRTSRTFVSYQARLFRKNRTEFRGVLHEKPTVHGNVGVLDQKKYYIDHVTTGMVHTAMGSYTKMERFQRFTYREHNMRMLEQVDRATRKAEISTKNISVWQRGLLATLKLYETLGFKEQDKEVSNFDYFMFHLMRGTAHQMRRRSLRGVLASLPRAMDYMREMKEWRDGRYADEDFEIARIINRIGVVRYLGLDRPSVVEVLNRKYANKKQGVELLIRLLREKYENKD